MSKLMSKARQERYHAFPGVSGRSRYYRIELRPHDRYVQYRYIDVGKPDGLEVLRGQRRDGKWVTAAWLVDKRRAEARQNGELWVDDERVLEDIEGPIRHVRGDIYRARPAK